MLTVIRMKKLEKVTLMRRMLTILLLCLMIVRRRDLLQVMMVFLM